jgi:Tol biopolymer transport system component
MSGRGVVLRRAIAALVLLAAAGAGGAEGARHATFPCDVCLVVVGVDGHGQRVLRRGPPQFSDISPDGTRLLYVKYQVGVFTSRLDGSDERLLVADAGARDVEASFSPDGRQVAYLHEDTSGAAACGFEIRLVGSDGSDDRRFQRCASRPVWSPDSQRLLFASSAPGESGRWWVAASDGSDRHVVGLWEARAGYVPRSPSWSPRGDAIAYQTYASPMAVSGHGTFAGGPMRGAATEVDLVGAEGTSIRAIPDAAVPSWSPDGARLAFTRVVPVASYFGDGDYSIWIADASGRRAHRIRKDFAISPVGWSPDGRLLVSVADGDIYTMRADGTAFHQITHDPAGGAISGLWWTTDGSHIRYFWWCTQEFERCGG